jgi:hypothetical protein
MAASHPVPTLRAHRGEVRKGAFLSVAVACTERLLWVESGRRAAVGAPFISRTPHRRAEFFVLWR